MKIRGAGKVHYDAGPNMTPLVDVVMVILIFFMVAGSFTGATHYLLSNTPISSTGAGGAAVAEDFVPDESLEVTVDQPLADQFRARVGGAEPVGDAAQLRGLLEARGRQYAAVGKPVADVQVLIAPRGDVKFGHLIKVYEAAQLAGFQKVAFTTAR